MHFFLDRLSERSTWRGLVMTLAALGISIEPQLMEGIIAAGIGVAGIIEALLPDPAGRMKP